MSSSVMFEVRITFEERVQDSTAIAALCDKLLAESGVIVHMFKALPNFPRSALSFAAPIRLLLGGVSSGARSRSHSHVLFLVRKVVGFWLYCSGPREG